MKNMMKCISYVFHEIMEFDKKILLLEVLAGLQSKTVSCALMSCVLVSVDWKLFLMIVAIHVGQGQTGRNRIQV